MVRHSVAVHESPAQVMSAGARSMPLGSASQSKTVPAVALPAAVISAQVLAGTTVQHSVAVHESPAQVMSAGAALM
jgi:hypothetical protein